MMLFINKMFLLLKFEDNILHENFNFQQFFVVVKMTERRKNQSEEWTYFTLLFIYFITVNKYLLWISVIRYINVQIIGIGSKKNKYRSITKFHIVVKTKQLLK